MYCMMGWMLPLVSDRQAMHESPWNIDNRFYCMDGDLNNKPTAMQSRLVTRSQCWTIVWIRLTVIDVFMALIVISAVNNIGTPNDPVPIYTVVQHCLLATDHNRIAVGLSSLSLYPCSKINNNRLNYSTKYTVLGITICIWVQYNNLGM